MKKVIAGLTAATLLFVLTLAVFAGPSAEKSGGTANKYEINFAIHTNQGTNEYNTIERFKNAVEKGSNGEIQVHLFPGAALGTEMENLEQIKIGEVQMSIFGDNLTSQLAPEFDPTVTPFVYPNVEEVYKTWTGPLGDKIKNALETRGNQYLVALQQRGARRLTTSVPVNSPADLRGIKLRIPEIASWVTVWRGLGALPTPVSWSETYSALQTKVVDAQENPVENIWVAKIYEVNKYIILTDHLYNVFHWTINKNFYNSLPGNYQTLIMEAAREATTWGDQQIMAHEENLLNQLKAQGAQVITVDRQAFINAARPYVEQVAAGWDPLARQEISKFFK
jgi:tripartite ATP-independent transporter DctP family solute receptor